MTQEVSKCRGCKQAHDGCKDIPADLGIASLFNEGEPHNLLARMFCSKCETVHKNSQSSLDPLACGHQSIMHKEIKDPSCFHPSCSEYKAQTEDDDCVFCAETLASNTCANLACGHVFHVHCMFTSWEYLYSSNPEAIKLANSCCPLCKAPIEISCEEYETIYNELNRVNELRSHMSHLIVAQIQHENGSDEGMPSNPLEYGMRNYTFYRCEKCTSVFCGGKRECGEAEVPAGTKMLCGACRSCTKHGEDFMTYKCRFCCSEASWFCFGHTHFCEPCHDEAHELTTGNDNEYINKSVPRCPGKDSCPLKLDHPAHGEEFGWCAACLAEECVDGFGADLHLLYTATSRPHSLIDVDEEGSILGSLFQEEGDSDMVIGSLFDLGDDTDILIGSLFASTDEDTIFGGLFDEIGSEAAVNKVEEEEDAFVVGGLFDDACDTEEEEPVVMGSLFDEEEPVFMGSLFDETPAIAVELASETDEEVVMGSLFDEEEVAMGSLFDGDLSFENPLEAASAVEEEPVMGSLFDELEQVRSQFQVKPSFNMPAQNYSYNSTPKKWIAIAQQLYCNWAHIVVVAATAALLNDLSCTAV